jgi:Flp pilus assembly protein TadG
MIVAGRRARRAATAVETALVMIPLMMVLCGIFEYGRLLMQWNLLNNAAREGCRYAVANNTSPTISADVTSVVTNVMAGQSTNFSNFTVTISGTRNGIATIVTDLAPGDLITVKVSGDFKFLNIIPLVTQPATLSLSSSCLMMCEGGT